MDSGGLAEYFKSYADKPSLFLNRKALQAAYQPTEILHREQQMQQVARVLAPSLKGEKPSNLFVYGKTGTGKTLTITTTTEQLLSVGKEQSVPLKVVYVNCKLKKVADTEYRLVAELARQFGREIPPTGLPTDEVYRIFYGAIEQHKGVVILTLDEVDQLAGKAGNEFLYNLTRITSELKNVELSIIGISNDVRFTEMLDPRVKSSLSEEYLVFPSYDAEQLCSILERRAQEAFNKGALQEGVIEKCAAYAAREHGDARRALELLRMAGEIAERKNKETIDAATLDEANNALDRNSILDVVQNQPQHYQLTLYAALASCTTEDPVFTGEIYEKYLKICSKLDIRSLTQRRVADIIAEYDMLGVIRAPVVSKGRYGRARAVAVSIAGPLREQITNYLETGLGIKND